MGASTSKTGMDTAGVAVLLIVGVRVSYSDRGTKSLNHGGCDAVKRNTSALVADVLHGFCNYEERVDVREH